MRLLVDLEAGGFDLVEVYDCSRLHVEVLGEPDDATFARLVGECGRFDPPDHLWLEVDAMRRMAMLCTDESWDTDFLAMIDFARSKGWTDATGDRVRAHIEWASGDR